MQKLTVNRHLNLLMWVIVILIMALYSTITVKGIAFFSFFLLGVKVFVYQRMKTIKGKRNLLIILQMISFALIWLSFKTYLGYDVGLHLILLAVVFKFFETETYRDYKILNLFLMFAVCSLTILKTDLMSLGILFLLAIILLAVMYELSKSREFSPSKDMLWSILKYVLVSFPILVILFVVFPRVKGNLPGLAQQQSQTGFSGKVDYNIMGQLLLDETPVLRLWSNHQTDVKNIYLKGKTLILKDGDWVSPVVSSRYLYMNYGTGDINEVYDYRIALEPTFDRFLFTLDHTVDTHIPNAIRNAFKLKENGDFNSGRIISTRLVYEGKLGENKSQVVSLNKEIIKPSVREFIKPYGKLSEDQFIEAMREYFQRHFTYTLSPGIFSKENFFNEMMYKYKSGLCLHFATLLAELLNAKGVPSNLVLGYAGGSYNSFGNYYLVRQSDAHAWVESWYKGKWHRIDPTLWVEPEVLQDSLIKKKGIAQLWNNILYYIDEKSTALNMLLINYDFDTQKRWIRNKLNMQVKWYQLFGTFLFLISFLSLFYGVVRYILMIERKTFYERLEEKLRKKLDRRGYSYCDHCSLYTYLKQAENREDVIVIKYLERYLYKRYALEEKMREKIPF